MFDLKFGSQMRSRLRIIDQTKHSEKVKLFIFVQVMKANEEDKLCTLDFLSDNKALLLILERVHQPAGVSSSRGWVATATADD